MNIFSSLVINRINPLLQGAALAFAATGAFGSTQPYITDHQINFGTGNKYLQVTDIAAPSPGPKIDFTRTYNSQSNDTSVIGHGWTAAHTEKLIIDTDEIILIQKGGRYVHFVSDGSGSYINKTGDRRGITAVAGGYQLTEKNGTVNLYDANGKITSKTVKNGNTTTYGYDAASATLTSITNNFGASLSFTYSGTKLSSVTGPQGTFSYTYDAYDNLTTVTQPDTTTITYIYDDPNDVHNLTGMINEEGQRILTVEYDASDRAVRSAKQNGEYEVTIDYPSDLERTVTNSLGVTTTYHLELKHGVVRVASYTGPGCSSCGSTSDMSYVYDDRLRITQKSDALGKVTNYTYDDTGNRLTKIDAVGTPHEKTTSYTYTADNKVKTVRVRSLIAAEGDKTTHMFYDSAGNLEVRSAYGYVNPSEPTEELMLTTFYSYNSLGQITSINGPRTDVNDVITMSYYNNDPAEGYNRGQLHTVANALGHVTTFANYNIHGQAETITNANEMTTTRTFNIRGQLLTSTTGGLTTSYSYDAAGDLQTITRPGDRTITYTYDAAGRVNSVSDDKGNSVSYTFNSEGQKTGAEVRDPQGGLTRYINFEYNDQGRVSKALLPGGAERSFDYDEVGNLVHSVNAASLENTMVYDLLSRLESTVEGDALEQATTGYTYDANNNLISAADDHGNVTSHIYDDFNRRIIRTSPETGLTRYAYDEAGNISAITDALNRTVSLTYDALNRPTGKSFGAVSMSFVYDQNTNGKGRLSSIVDQHGIRSFLYNSLGELAEETREIGGHTYGTSYDYNAATGDLESIIYPTGTAVRYSYDANGEVHAVTVDGTTVIDGVARLPFGPLASATLAPGVDAGITMRKAYDERYNLQNMQVGSGNLSMAYSRDAEGHVTSIDGILEPSPAALDEMYGYDEASNKLISRGATTYTYDAVGNVVSDGNLIFIYDELNRIIEVQGGATTAAAYGYDASNRRIIKTVGAMTIHFHYDANSNLIAETLADGAPIRDYIYLDGELLAQKTYGVNGQIYYYINDHLGTPQKLISADGIIVWQAAYLPFGKAQIVLENMVNNIRFPGQYYDAETGLHYNWHRYYSPETGRYISADPIGLAGGMNLYAYAKGNPIMYIDINGLDVTVCFYPEAAMGFGHVGLGLPEGSGGTVGFYPHEDEDREPEGQIRPDLYTERECITIETTCEEDECVRNCINQRAGNPGNYSLLRRQCAGFARDCLRQCGLPSGLSNQPNPTIWFNHSNFDR